MSKPGPKKMPTKLLKLHGSWLAKKRKDIDLGEYKPICPRELRPEAKKVWKKLIPELEKAGILAKVDADALAMLCQARVDWYHWDRLCQEAVIKTVAGNVISNPLVDARNKAEKRYKDLMSVFGIGPANRAGIGSVQRAKSGEGKARFFNKDGFGA